MEQPLPFTEFVRAWLLEWAHWAPLVNFVMLLVLLLGLVVLHRKITRRE